jgi:(heptosyl)LPS beta-1,4-glucosyltransferase
VGSISVIVNTLNEEQNLGKALDSVKNIADEIIVVDMHSSDSTVEIAKKYKAEVFLHKNIGYVEPARNYAISKARKNWILILDADEEITPKLAKRLKEISEDSKADYYRIPRKNIIFGKWIKYSRWWPDYNIRFFRKNSVSWNNEIHSVPLTQGVGADLEAKEDLAIIHYNYSSIEQYLERMNRYTTIQSDFLTKQGYRFIWKDLIDKPMQEFMGRYFSGEGYKDGLHGLALGMLQAFSELVLYIKVWQKEKFQNQSMTLDESITEFEKVNKDFHWWIQESYIRNGKIMKTLSERIKRLLKKK